MDITGEHVTVMEVFSFECLIKGDHAACNPVMTELCLRCACDCHKTPAAPAPPAVAAGDDPDDDGNPYDTWSAVDGGWDAFTDDLG
jgi:hypothetical protein